jgi:hypothetical protein
MTDSVLVLRLGGGNRGALRNEDTSRDKRRKERYRGVTRWRW